MNRFSSAPLFPSFIPPSFRSSPPPSLPSYPSFLPSLPFPSLLFPSLLFSSLLFSSFPSLLFSSLPFPSLLFCSLFFSSLPFSSLLLCSLPFPFLVFPSLIFFSLPFPFFPSLPFLLSTIFEILKKQKRFFFLLMSFNAVYSGLSWVHRRKTKLRADLQVRPVLGRLRYK